MIQNFEMNRRRLLQRAFVLAGAAASLSACNKWSAASVQSPFKFSTEQMATVKAAANVIVPRTDTPGALDAGVPALLEGLMSDWASAETRETVAGAVAAINALAPNSRSFAALEESEQVALLKAFDTSALSPVSAAGPPVPKDPAYALFKDSILTLYYFSEAALTQELSYDHVPGRWDPSIPVTSNTRPSGAPGMFD